MKFLISDVLCLIVLPIKSNNVDNYFTQNRQHNKGFSTTLVIDSCAETRKSQCLLIQQYHFCACFQFARYSARCCIKPVRSALKVPESNCLRRKYISAAILHEDNIYLAEFCHAALRISSRMVLRSTASRFSACIACLSISFIKVW